MAKLRVAKDETESAGIVRLKSAESVLSGLMDWISCGYLLLLIVIWPFYNSQGYLMIGTDKSVFYRTATILVFWILAPLLTVRLTVHGVLFFREKAGVRMERARRFVKELSLTDRFALLYGGAVILSWLCSDYRKEALWGANAWFLGMIPQLFFVGLYFLVSRLWRRREWLIGLLLPVSAVVFGLGYLNRFGVYPIELEGGTPDYISTIGNINWYCGYLVTVMFCGVFLFWRGAFQRRWQKALMAGYVSIGFATLVTQGSSSGILALGGVLLTLFCLSAPDAERMKAFWKTCVLLGLVCLVTLGIRLLFPGAITRREFTTELLTYSIVPPLLTAVFLGIWLLVRESAKRGRYPRRAFRALAAAACLCLCLGLAVFVILVAWNTARPGSLGPLSEASVFTFSPKWGSNRGATWKAGAMCFLEQGFFKKWVGVGPDAMSAYIYTDGSQALLSLVQERFGVLRLTNAHNEWLTVLVNTGILGLAGYAGLVISAVVRFLRAGKSRLTGSGTAAFGTAAVRGGVIAGACGLGILAYTVNNIVSFQQTFDTALVFVLLGAGEAFLRGEKSHES